MGAAVEGNLKVRQIKLLYFKVSSRYFIYTIIKKCVININVIYIKDHVNQYYLSI